MMYGEPSSGMLDMVNITMVAWPGDGDMIVHTMAIMTKAFK